MKQQAGQMAPPLLPYDELQDFYFTHGGGQAFVPQLPAPANAVGTIVAEEDIVTREEAQKAFENVQETFANIGDEHARMKEGLQGLASEIDAVRGKATEDMQKLAHNADAALQRASSVASDLSARMSQAESQQASAKLTSEQTQATSAAALKETADVRRDQ